MAKQEGSIQHLYLTAAEFAEQNTVLLPGQFGVETDTMTSSEIKFKCGNRLETPYNDLPYAFDARFKALEDRITTGYFPVLPTDPGITIDSLGRVNYQNDLLKNKSNYMVEPLQLNAKFSMVDGVDLLYKPTTGGFTILKDGFVLDATYGLIIWVNSKISGGSAGGGDEDTSGLQLQLDSHEDRISGLEEEMPLKADLTGDNTFHGHTIFEGYTQVSGGLGADLFSSALIQFGYAAAIGNSFPSGSIDLESTYLVFDRTTPLTINAVTGGLDGTIHYFVNLGPGAITVKNSATMLMPNGTDLIIGQGQFATFTHVNRASNSTVLFICTGGSSNVSDLPALNGKDAFSTGGAQVLQKAITDHEADHGNPHQVTLEQARQQNAQLGGDIDANGHQIDNLSNPNTDQQAATKIYSDQILVNAKAYADGLATGVYRSAGDWNASVGTYPTTGTGTAGAIRRGDTYNVSVAGNMGGFFYDLGDKFYAIVNAPGQTAANWGDFDHNTQQATETMRGTAMVATAATIGNENTLEDTTFVTGKKLWLSFVPRFVQLGWTWAAKQIFSVAPRFSSVTAGQYLKADANKDLTSVSTIPGTDISTDSTHRFTNDTDIAKLGAIAPGATANSAASAAETNTGTDNAKYVTPADLASSKYIDQNGGKTYAAAGYTLTAPNDVYAVNLTPPITAYTTGLQITAYVGNINTTTLPVMNINGLGNKAIVKGNGAAIEIGDLAPGIYTFVYHSSGRFFIESSGIQSASNAETIAGTNSTKFVTSSGLAAWLTNVLANSVVFSGAVRFVALAALSNKMLMVDAAGNMIGGPNVDTGGFISDGDIVTEIVNATNNNLFTAANNYQVSINPANSKVFNQGKWFNGGQYLYFAAGDNLVRRMIGG